MSSQESDSTIISLFKSWKELPSQWSALLALLLSNAAILIKSFYYILSFKLTEKENSSLFSILEIL